MLRAWHRIRGQERYQVSRSSRHVIQKMSLGQERYLANRSHNRMGLGQKMYLANRNSMVKRGT
eukprot:1458751-Rhodomonas_salina.1